MRRTFLTITALTALTFLPACQKQVDQPLPPASGSEWVLSGADSGMTYITVKQGDLGEINTFRNVSGRIGKDGTATIEVSLDSVDTNNETRDPRMKEHLFETQTYPLATARAAIDLAKFDGLAIGDRHTELLDLTIDLHGVSESYEFYVLVTRLGANKVSVENKAPLLLDARDFGMEAGLAKLQELAGLDSITPVVPVTMSFVFERGN